jgi:hypothetical protein
MIGTEQIFLSASSAVICPRRASSAGSGFIVVEIDKEKVIGMIGC